MICPESIHDASAAESDFERMLWRLQTPTAGSSPVVYPESVVRRAATRTKNLRNVDYTTSSPRQ